MKKIRKIYILLIVIVTVGVGSMQGQTTDTANALSVNTSNVVSDDAGQRQDTGRNMWLVIGIIVGLGIVGGVVVMRMRRKGDNRPQTGSDINNPASGI